NTQSNFSYVKGFVLNVWHAYLEKPVMKVWSFFLTYIWGPAIGNLQHLNSRQPLNTPPPMMPPIPRSNAI
ncbi:MAG: hypothetical protein JWO73_448, partial [Candidatus Taylorbacteria bacterium]|nr:hypothetical protein [Candidatus Taylorbacteria bacterium]